MARDDGRTEYPQMPNALTRLAELKPWDNVNEEDLYRVNGLYLSIRGNVRLPEGVWATREQHHAARWVAEPDLEPAASDWAYDAQKGEITALGIPTEEVESALHLALNQFEGKPHEGVEFPIWLNPTEEER